ncbi:PIN domain-like protein, partial [Dendrothele bispora CBS 962.96]
LAAVFSKLRFFLSMPIVFVFVFDGPQRPLEKRKKTVRTTPHWMTKPFTQLVETLGHHVHQVGYIIAPGEAEAELAMLNTVGAIHAVLTDDSDAFVFGAKTIIRQPRKTKDPNLFEIYHSYLMEKKLTQNGILLVAVLQGGDYHKGLRGCGPTTSLELANTGLGTDLRFAADEDDATLHQLRWKSNFQRKLYEELAYNPNDLLSQKKVKLAESIPDSFPPMDVVRKYVFPVVSQSF